MAYEGYGVNSQRRVRVLDGPEKNVERCESCKHFVNDTRQCVLPSGLTEGTVVYTAVGFGCINHAAAST